MNWQLAIRAAAGICFVMVIGCGKPQHEEPNAPTADQATPTPSPTPTATPAPTATPIVTVPRSRMEVSRLFNEMQIESEVVTEQSDQPASVERVTPDAYSLQLTVHAQIPKASQSLEEISRNDPTLSGALPGIAALIQSSKVSPAFDELYRRKVAHLESNLARIDSLLSRHNFYDCETILEIENPESGRRALLMKGDMDVNTDGSDGDRNFEVDGSSMFFQPQTSFRWRRQTDRPNPFQKQFEERLAAFQAEYAIVGLPAERNRELEAGIRHAEATLYELGVYSFLIAGADPYIVLPTFMIREMEGPFAPKIGDYAVVVFDGIAYPAILGDAGPSFKFGEASTRLCVELNPKSSPISRPVSSVKVSYLVFPGTKDEVAAPPDLNRWHSLCAKYLKELGLEVANLHHWENLIQPWPTPTPAPTPTSEPTPTAEPASISQPASTPADPTH